MPAEAVWSTILARLDLLLPLQVTFAAWGNSNGFEAQNGQITLVINEGLEVHIPMAGVVLSP